MTFTLNRVVPWGRSLEEYRRMFALTDADCEQNILGCADGPASFNCELSRRGGSVISADPIYRFSTEQIRTRIEETTTQITEYARQNPDEFIWSDEIPDPDFLAKHRLAAMNRFLDDFEGGLEVGRYVTAELPKLP